MNDRPGAPARRRRPGRWWPASWLPALLLVLVSPASAGELAEWFEGDLTPWLTEQLATHPRFKGEPLRVAVFDGDVEDATPNLLAARLVGRLEARLARSAGIHLAWRPSAPDWAQQTLSMKQHCRPADDAYVVAVDASRPRAPLARVRVRILDVHERQWVPGVSREWQGRLDRDETVELQANGTREDLLGNRDLPFRQGQEDLLAARAARSLGCDLLAHPADGLRLWAGENAGGEADRKVARLVPQYLAGSGLLRVAEDRTRANMILSVESQVLDGGTRQLWIALVPSDGDPALPSIRTSVYASEAGTPPPAPLPVERPAYAGAAPGKPDARAAVGDLRATLLPGGVLEVSAPGFRHVELLALNRDGSVARIDPAACHGASRPAGTDALRVTLPWEAREDYAAVFVVAATGHDAADALAREFAAFPIRCRGPGLRGAALKGRLVMVERRLATYGGDIRWRQVAVVPPVAAERLAGGLD